MAAERWPSPQKRKAPADNHALREIREGRASPMISAALDDVSGELLPILAEQIGAMDADQRRHLRRVLAKVHDAMHGDAHALEEVDDGSYRLFSSVIGMIIGGALEAATGIGNLMIGGIASGLAIEQYFERCSDAERSRIHRRLDRCLSLMDTAAK